MGGTCYVNNGIVSYSYCDGNYCEEGSYEGNTARYCWTDLDGSGCTEEVPGEYQNNSMCGSYDGVNYCTTENWVYNGGISNAVVCEDEHISNSTCTSYDYMEQTNTSTHSFRECLEISGFECITWGEWHDPIPFDPGGIGRKEK